jgi:hypothetical protein
LVKYCFFGHEKYIITLIIIPKYMPSEDYLEGEQVGPNILRAAAVVNKLVALYCQSPDSPHRQSDIEACRHALARLDIHQSWYAQSVLTPPAGSRPWYEWVLRAHRMANPQDPEFGSYKKARVKSQVAQALAKVENEVNLRLAIDTPGNDQHFQQLTSAVTSFETLKALSTAVTKNI